jgi:fatty-acyl-CoA synthase
MSRVLNIERETQVTACVEFRSQLLERMLASGGKVLFRVAVAPSFDCPLEFTGSAMLARAEGMVSSLNLTKESGIVLMLLPHSPELFLLHLGLVLNGHTPAILAWPTSRIDPDKYQHNLVHQLSNLPADRLVTLPQLAENLSGSLPYPTCGMRLQNSAAYEKMFPAGPVSQRLEHREKVASSTRPNPDTLFLQFSGGTTGAQKAICVTSQMLREQFGLLGEALDFTSKDHVTSWLPMYHDMGLIACFWMPLWHGASSLQIGANDWILKPELLFEYISRYGSSLCWLPNFSFSYLAQRRDQMQQKYDLGSVRAWINCSEPVRLKSLVQFADAFSECGVKKDYLQASYAMAETTFAITQSQLGREPMTLPKSLVHRGNVPYTTLAFDLIDDVYVSSGKPIRNTQVKVVAPDGSECTDSVPGEIYVRTPCLFSGYWGVEGFKTHSLHEGWHATGDFGFTVDDELFVIGRLRDIAIVGGQNIFPEDVEAVVNIVDGVHPGRVVAFGIEDHEYGTQSLAVIAEATRDLSEQIALDLETSIRELVLNAIGVAPRYVAIVPRQWIVKSTAGKISRRETRERFVRERLAAV